MENLLGKELGHQESSRATDSEDGEWPNVVIQPDLSNVVFFTLRKGQILHVDPGNGKLRLRHVGTTIQIETIPAYSTVP